MHLVKTKPNYVDPQFFCFLWPAQLCGQHKTLAVKRRFKNLLPWRDSQDYQIVQKFSGEREREEETTHTHTDTHTHTHRHTHAHTHTHTHTHTCSAQSSLSDPRGSCDRELCNTIPPVSYFSGQRNENLGRLPLTRFWPKFKIYCRLRIKMDRTFIGAP